VTPDEADREWLARELHDSVQQTLYGIGLGAGTAAELLDRDPVAARRQLDWIRTTALAGLTDLRGLILRLRPEESALAAALVRMLDTAGGLGGFRTNAELGPEPATTAEVRHALYRIAQEAVHNVARHADADSVTLRMSVDGPTVVLAVVDDGRGFVPGEELPGRLGIRSMHERARAAGGRLEIASAPGAGTEVRATLPAGA
jgi:signal transduction histidine kinase